jgi:hypothetical protein
MNVERASRRGLAIAVFVVGALAAAAIWGSRWWERRLLRDAQALAGVDAPVRPGGLTESRGKIDPGRTGKQVEDAVGRPSIAVGTEGSSKQEVWTYYYADGTMTVNLTDGIVKRVSIIYGTPRIPRSKRK